MRLEQTTVAQIMQPELVTLGADESLRRAAQRMQASHMRCLLVPPGRAGEGIGIVTAKDIVQTIMQEGENCLDELLVADIMTKPAICVQADLPLSDCFQLMRSTGVRRVPVQRGSELVGLVSYTDLFGFLTS